MIQSVTDRSIADLVQERIFGPCGLHETGWGPAQREHLVADLLQSGEAHLHNGTSDGSAHNLYVSGPDLLRWGELHRTRGALDGEQLLPPALFDWVTADQSPAELTPGHPRHGFCWWVQSGVSARTELGPTLPEGSYQGLGVNGCHVIVIPAIKTVAVRLMNKVGNPPGYDYLPQVRRFGDLVYQSLR